MSFNFMAAVTICSDFGAQKNKVVKNLPANAGDIRDVGLITGSGRSPGGGHGNPLSTLPWRIPGKVEPDGLLSLGSHRVGHD